MSNFEIPPICFSITVYNGKETIVSEGFNCYESAVVADELESIARRLRAMNLKHPQPLVADSEQGAPTR